MTALLVNQLDQRQSVLHAVVAGELRDGLSVDAGERGVEPDARRDGVAQTRAGRQFVRVRGAVFPRRKFPLEVCHGSILALNLAIDKD